jgi:glutaredoxin
LGLLTAFKNPVLSDHLFNMKGKNIMKIEVLGSGCPTCKKLYEFVQKIAKDEKWETEVSYITGTEGMQKIIEMNQMSSPVLTVNGKVAMVGFIPDAEKIKQKILAVSER